MYRLSLSRSVCPAGTPPGTKGKFEVKKTLGAESVVAKVLMAARDPEIDIPAASPQPQTAGTTDAVKAAISTGTAPSA
jgi:hypothetical protein